MEEHADFYRAIAEAADDFIYVLGPDLRFIYVNAAAAKCFGTTAEGFRGKLLREIFPGGFERQEKNVRRVFATGEPLYVEAPYSIMGKTVWMSARLSPLRNEAGEVTAVAGISRDITERKLLAQHISENSRREAQGLGHALHDSVGQELAGLMFFASTLNKSLAAESHPQSRNCERLVALASQALKHTRLIVRGLSPVESLDEGLVVALRQLSEATDELYGVSCTYRTEGAGLVFDNAVATHLYYIAREAVANAIRHASPRRVTICLSTGEDAGTLTVEDDGPGLRLPVDSDGMGLKTMRFRADAIGGALALLPGADGGTRVVCEFPNLLAAGRDSTA